MTLYVQILQEVTAYYVVLGISDLEIGLGAIYQLRLDFFIFGNHHHLSKIIQNINNCLPFNFINVSKVPFFDRLFTICLSNLVNVSEASHQRLKFSGPSMSESANMAIIHP